MYRKALIAVAILGACATTEQAPASGGEPESAASYDVTDPAVLAFMAETVEAGNYDAAPSSLDQLAENRAYLPFVRVPPRGFERCAPVASSGEVALTFDVLPSGLTQNVKATRSTHPCFEPYAEKAVRLWRYLPPKIEGEPSTITGVETIVRFRI